MNYYFLIDDLVPIFEGRDIDGGIGVLGFGKFGMMAAMFIGFGGND